MQGNGSPSKSPGQVHQQRPSRAAARSRPTAVHVLIVLLLLLGISALGGGAGLIIDPSGDALGMPVSLLAGSPFHDYLVPGVILFGLLGVCPAVVVFMLWFRPNWARMPRAGLHGAWYAAMVLGIALIVWILVQMTILRFFLQPILLALGVGIIGVGMLPAVRRHYRHVAPGSDASEG